MKHRLLFGSLVALITCVVSTGSATPTEDRLWATRVTCELQTAGPASLPALYWQQGTSPLLSLDQYRSGRAVDADTNVTAVLRLAPTATNLVGWVSVTNYATVGNGYLIQMPTVGTNTTASGAWWYTAYFIRGTAVYWTGSGRVTITETTSTGENGLVWQEILPPGSLLTWEDITGKPLTFPPDAHTHPYTEITNPPWLTEYIETDEIALAALYGTNAILAAAITNEAALREAGDAAGSNHVAAATNVLNASVSAQLDIKASTASMFAVSNRVAVLETNTVTRAEAAGWETGSHAGLATTGDVAAAIAAIPAADAFWPHNATASSWFTFFTNSSAITITGYNIAGGTDVVIPDYINGFPVTEISENAFAGSGVASIGGAGNVVTVGDYAFVACSGLTSVSLPQVQTIRAYAFANCISLTSVSLPQAQTIGDNAFVACSGLTSVSLPQVQTIRAYAFANCISLTSVSLPQAQTIGDNAFVACSGLTSVSLPQAQTIGEAAFGVCGGLTSVYFDNDAPTIGAEIFVGIPPNQVTNYVTNPQATGWGATLGDMPVVRPPLYASAVYQAGELVATTGHVAQAIAAIPVPDMSSRVAVQSGHATNLAVSGWLALPQSEATNLVLRLVSSNEHIIVQEVYE